MALIITVTDAGRAALVNAANTGTAPVVIARVGLSGAAITPAKTATVLPGEFRRIDTLSGDVVANDTIHMIVRDESAAMFTLRSFALYLGDGTLFAIYGQPDAILEKASQSMMLLAIDVQFADVNATQLTFGNANFLNPPATTERQGVVELATVAEAQAGIDALRVLTPTAAKAAILGWLLTQDGSGSGLDSDLLDGQQGSWYADIPSRLGFTPVNKAGDTITGNVSIGGQTWFAGDARFSLLRNSDGFPVFTWDSGDYFYYDRSANVLGLVVADGYRFGFKGDGFLEASAGFRAAGNIVWHGGNDGAGSGLDADLLDGQQGSWYADIPSRLGYTPLNKAGDTITGNLSISGQTWFAGDSQFYLSKNGSNFPVLSFDAGDYFYYDRSANVLGLVVANGYRFGFKGDGFLEASAGFRAAGNIVWHGGNDGAGSGLDADLLDGLDSDAYARRAGTNFTGAVTFGDINNVLTLNAQGNPIWIWAPGHAFTFDRATNTAGFVSANQMRVSFSFEGVAIAGSLDVGETIRRAGNKVWDAGNDGAGSGLDADLLDGLDGDAYARRAGTNFTGAVTFGDINNALTLNAQGNPIWIWAPGHAFTFDRATNTSGIVSANQMRVSFSFEGVAIAGSLDVGETIRRAGNKVWDAGNDGSGSGLDADLLDGFQASDFDRIVAINLAENGGFIIFASGFKKCWGVATVNPNSESTITYPITFDAFSNASFAAARNIIDAQDNDPQVRVPGTTSFSVYSAADVALTGRWRAEGR